MADDLVIFTRGDFLFWKAVQILNKNCSELSLSINHDKSGVMVVRRDERQRYITRIKNACGFPVVKSYKYLGIHLDAKGMHDVGKDEKKKIFD